MKIPAPEKPFLQFQGEGNTKDIMQSVLRVAKEKRHELAAFSKGFSPTKSGLEKLWNYVKTNIHYVEDKDNPLYAHIADNVQVIQSPAQLWQDREIGGDCKSHTVFVSSALYNMGVPHKIRFVSYSKTSKLATHVYCHAILNGKDVNMDTVYHGFDEEAKYVSKQDFDMATNIYEIGVLPITQDIVNAGFGDVTEMTTGKLLRHQKAEQMQILASLPQNKQRRAEFLTAAAVLRNGTMQGIGAMINSPIMQSANSLLRATENLTHAAFTPPTQGESVGNFFTDQWKKLMNWIVKGAANKFAPFFLYQFLPNTIVRTQEVVKRIEAQNKIIAWIIKVTKIDSEVLMATFYTGILKTCGATPEEIAKASADLNAKSGKVGFLPMLAPALAPSAIQDILKLVITAIEKLIDLVKEIGNLFKANTGEVSDAVSVENASDISLLVKKEVVKPAQKTDNNVLVMTGLGLVAGFFVLKWMKTI